MPNNINNSIDDGPDHPHSLHTVSLPSTQSYSPSPDHSPSPLAKKKHVCSICSRAFTTSGHLSRHTRIHTGERNHKCPFPGCETRCSRQDNLQQHYRIHLSPGSRRSSGSATRAAMNRASAVDRPRSSRRRSDISASIDPVSPSPPPPIPSPPLEPPPLTPAYQPIPPPAALSAVPEPPDTPPPLTPAYPTLPPPTAPVPVYSQHHFPGRDPTRSSRSTPDTSYHSPVAYGHQTLPGASYPHYEDSHPYSSSQDNRSSSSFHRTADDPRWAYQQPYSTSDPDRYSPASPVHYPDSASPVDSYHTAGAGSRGTHHLVQPQEPSSYFGHYSSSRQGTSALAAATTAPPSASAVSLAASQPPSSHRHSIAHISNPVRPHSPSHSASPVVSQPPTPAAAYAYVSSASVGSYAESPPSSVSPVAPASQLPSGMVAATYGSYESNSLASAGYTHPPPPPSASTQPQAYDRTLPSLSREPQPQSILHTPFHYGQTAYPDPRRSPPPILAPIQDTRTVRRESATPSVRYASPPMQSLASVSRGSGHALSYPPTSHQHSPTYPQPSYSYGASPSAHPHGSGHAPASSGHPAYYYQHAVVPQREASPEAVGGAAEQYLEVELHPSQTHRGMPAGHPHQHASHQYLQTGAVMGGSAGGGGGGGGQAHSAHGTWRAEDYRGRGGLVQ
ncbi:hypothetical protein ACG7TL_004280 [Trametes sanguinea]